MALLNCRDCCLHFGPKIIFDKVNFRVDAGERVSLVGQNGVGKSTFFKSMLNQVELDSGEVIYQGGLKITALGQEVPADIKGPVFDVVLEGLGKTGKLLAQYELLSEKAVEDPEAMEALMTLSEQIEHENGWSAQHKAHTVISKLKLDGDTLFEGASGGLKRRIMLARALVAEPDVLLLDEPTNHLDIESVEWLESFLPQFQGAIIFITHDRRFLENVATRIIELDRGHLQSFEGRYHEFLKHKEAELEAEQNANAEFDKKLAIEETWVRQGIKARRTRNEGRVRALEKMRQEASARIKRAQNAQMVVAQAEGTARKVIDATNISYDYNGKSIFEKFSILITRGDKIGVIGPNGCGKSTLLNVLLGKLDPKMGTIKYGNDLIVAYSDQLRGQLDPEKTIIDNIAEGSEYLDINGKQMHIYSYLRRFLFAPERAREKVRVLSGGERNRCLLAKVMSKPSNVLVLDEPTNDLDMDSLELLEELLVEYPGTLLLVSHDRDFINNVVSSVVAFDDNGELNQYVGGYNDWIRQRPSLETEKESNNSANKQRAKTQKKELLTIPERKELAELPANIEKAEAHIAELVNEMASPGFYDQDQVKIDKVQEAHQQTEANLSIMYERWELLEAKQNQGIK